MTAPTVKLKPGDTIGILGGGQLGRMLAGAAARLGFRCQIFASDPDSPAFDVVQHATCAEYADVEALELFANDVDLVTYEFENVPAAAAMILAARRPVLPEYTVLGTTQDRLAEKDFVTRLGISTAAYADVSRSNRCAPRSRASSFRPSSRPAASAMTARARRSSAKAMTSSGSGSSSPPNPRFSKPSSRSSGRFR